MEENGLNSTHYRLQTLNQVDSKPYISPLSLYIYRYMIMKNYWIALSLQNNNKSCMFLMSGYLRDRILSKRLYEIFKIWSIYTTLIFSKTVFSSKKVEENLNQVFSFCKLFYVQFDITLRGVKIKHQLVSFGSQCTVCKTIFI